MFLAFDALQLCQPANIASEKGESCNDVAKMLEAALLCGIFAGFRFLLFGQSSAFRFGLCQCLLLLQFLAFRIFFLALRELAFSNAGSEESEFSCGQHVGVGLVELFGKVEAATLPEEAGVASHLAGKDF